MFDMLSIKEKQNLLEEMSELKDESDSRRISAFLWRLTLLEFEKFRRNDFHSGKLVEHIKLFCKANGVTLSTLYRKRLIYKKQGIKGLMPNYEKEKPQTKKIVGEKLLEIHYHVDLDNPIISIWDIVNSIHNSKSIPSSKKALLEMLLDFINSIKNFRKKNNSLRVNRKLNEDELRVLHELKNSTHRNIVRRATVVDMLLKNEPLFNIVIKSQRASGTIYRWKSRFEKEGMKFLSVKHNEMLANNIMEERKNRIAKIIHYQPNHYNINRSSWSLISLAEAYQKDYGEKINSHAISKSIKEMGYTFKKAKKVLTSEDPHYQEKVNAIKDVRKSLTVAASFFL